MTPEDGPLPEAGAPGRLARLAGRFATLGLQGKITLALVVGSLVISGTVALAALVLARHQLTQSTEALLAAEAQRERLEIELRLDAAVAVAESLADNTITANALADSVGRETYLDPLLRNQKLAIPGATLALTDYRGKTLAANDATAFAGHASDPAFQRLMASGRAEALLTRSAPHGDATLVLMLPVVYRLTSNVEGAIVLRIPLAPLLNAGVSHDWRYLVDRAGTLLAGSQPVGAVLEARAPLRLAKPLDRLGLYQALARDRSIALRDLDTMLWVFVVVGLGLVALVVAASQLAARWLAAPLGELTEASEEIAATGQPHLLRFTRGGSEYERLTRAFNEMVRRVQRSYAELEERVEQRTRALAASERRLQTVMEATGEGLWDWNIRTDIVTHNQKWCATLGLDPHYVEHPVEAFLDLLHPDDRPEVEAAIAACIEHGHAYNHEHRMRRPDGRVIWVLDRGKVVERDAAGAPLRMAGSLIDITDRREATEALRVRELYLRATLDNLPFLFWLKDAEGRFLAVNRMFADACGRAGPPAVVGLTDLDVWPRDLAERYRADDRAVMNERAEKAVEEPVESNGVRRWIETYKKPVIAENGSILGTVGFARDITARKEMERALEASEQRWELAVTGSNDGIWDWNTETGEVYFSERWKAMLGYAADEIGNRYEDFAVRVHPEDRPRLQSAVDSHLHGETRHFEAEFRMRCSDGGYKWILSRGRALFDAAGHAIRMTGSHADVTARRAAEAALRDRTEQLDAIFALSPDGFVSFDAGRRVRYISPAFLRMTGMAGDSLVGLSEPAFSAALAARCVAGARFGGIATLRDDTPAAGAAAGRRELIELDGAGRRVLEVGLRTAGAETVSQILYFRDVTHETEVDQMKSEFLSTAAHELRTPMASIYGFTELLLHEEFDHNTLRDLLQTIFDQADLMTSIINELLDLARIEARRGKDFVLERIALDELVGSGVAAFRVPAGRAAPQVSTAEGPIEVQVDRKKLLQIIGNILSNAYKYSPAGGPVTVTVDGTSGPDGRAAARVRVRDTGIGMTPAQVARVCERFFRADTSGKIPGTGLGMSIVKEIVELHRGHVEIESHPGAGTTVTILLPKTSG